MVSLEIQCSRTRNRSGVRDTSWIAVERNVRLASIVVSSSAGRSQTTDARDEDVRFFGEPEAVVVGPRIRNLPEAGLVEMARLRLPRRACVADVDSKCDVTAVGWRGRCMLQWSSVSRTRVRTVHFANEIARSRDVFALRFSKLGPEHLASAQAVSHTLSVN